MAEIEFEGLVTDFDPHQLDFDWRFNEESVSTIVRHVDRQNRVLLIGCPSLMEAMAPNISAGLLIERNPYHDHFDKFSIVQADARYYEVRSKHRNMFDAAVFDAPWYPAELLRWAGLALSFVRRGGRILFVLWPEETRPMARYEHERIFSILKQVGTLETIGKVSYEIPGFEKASLHQGSRAGDLRREGILLSLVKNSSTPFPKIEFGQSRYAWRRYQLSGKQLAIRIYPNVVRGACCSAFEIKPHILTNTSRRNLEIDSINVWDSNNTVARVRNPNFLDKKIYKLSRGVTSKVALDFLSELQLASDGNKIQWGRTWIHRA